MLQVALKLKKSLTQLASNELAMKAINDVDWTKVKIVVALLHPFKVATEEICSENYFVISRLYSVFTAIKDYLNDCSEKALFYV